MNSRGIKGFSYIGVFSLLFITLASVAMAAAPDGAPGADGERDTMFSLIVKGGVIMIPIFIGSIIAVAIAVERFISLRRKKVIPPGFMDGLTAAWAGGLSKADAVKYCESVGGTAGAVFKAGIMRLHKGEDAVEKAIEDAGYREADKMKRSLKGLSIVASISPLLGLLGTVYGMIDAFQNTTVKGMDSGGAGEMLARGIYEALVTTAAGLTVAIPVLLLYQVLNAKVDRIVDDLDEMGLEFISSYTSDNGSVADAVL